MTELLFSHAQIATMIKLERSGRYYLVQSLNKMPHTTSLIRCPSSLGRPRVPPWLKLAVEEP